VLSFNEITCLSNLYAPFTNSKTACYIYERVISRNDSRLSFVQQAIDGRPSLEARAEEIEVLCSLPSSDIQLDNQTKQFIGVMVKKAIEDFGYDVDKDAPIEGFEYFRNAMIYRYRGSERLRIIDGQIVEVFREE